MEQEGRSKEELCGLSSVEPFKGCGQLLCVYRHGLRDGPAGHQHRVPICEEP